MRKLLLFFALAGFLAGCSNDPADDKNVTPGGNEVTFSGSVVKIETKTTLDEGTTIWSTDDSIGIFGIDPQGDNTLGTNVKYNATENAANTGFAPADESDKIGFGDGAGTRKYYAYYPYDVLNTDYDFLEVSVPQEQTYADGDNKDKSFMYAAAEATEAGNIELSFKNVFAVVSFGLKGSVTITEMLIEPLDDNNTTNLTGNYIIDISETDPEAIYYDGGTKSIHVTFTDGLTLTSTEVGIPVAFAPFQSTGGMRLTFVDDQDRIFEKDIWVSRNVDIAENAHVYQPIASITANDFDPSQLPDGTVVWTDDFSNATGTAVLSSLSGSVAPFTDAYTVTNVYANGGSLKFSSSSNNGTMTTPKFSTIVGETNVYVTFDADGWSGKSGQEILVTVNGDGTPATNIIPLTSYASVTSGTIPMTGTQYFFQIEGATSETSLTFAANNPGVDRRFMLDNLTVTVGSLDLNTLEVDIEDIQDVPAAGDTYTITVTSDTDWTVETANDWISFSTDSGTGNGTFDIIVEDNSGIERNGMVTVSPGLGSVGVAPISITVNQEGGIAGQSYTEVFPGDLGTSYAGSKTAGGEYLTWTLYGCSGRNASDINAFPDITSAVTLGQTSDNGGTGSAYSYAYFESEPIADGVKSLIFDYCGNGRAFRVEVLVDDTVVFTEDFPAYNNTSVPQSSGVLDITGADANAVLRFINTAGSRRVTIGNITWTN